MAKKGIHVNVYKLPDGTWRCDLKLNTTEAGEGITVRGTSEDDGSAIMGSWWSALSKAGRALAKTRLIAQSILSNPAVAAAFPQYVAPALATLKAIEVAEKRGLLGKVKKQFRDPTLKKLASEVDEMSKGQRTAMSGGGVCLCEHVDRPRRSSMGSPAFGLQSARGAGSGPFGLPEGNPHPFAAYVEQLLRRGALADPTMAQKLARMNAYQRAMAKASR